MLKKKESYKKKFPLFVRKVNSDIKSFWILLTVLKDTLILEQQEAESRLTL